MNDKRKLGNSELLVSPLTFGGNVFGWTINEQQSFKMLDGFIGSGFNFIDTADTVIG
jgi:aryl-alcohol dehydrogenase-like predicted oxidoreductase